MESNFNHHGRWTFCLLQQFADFQQAVVLFLFDELAYPAFYPLPYFLTLKKKYYHIFIVMPLMIQIMEFIVGILNMTLFKFNIISNQFAKVLERKS